MVTDLSNIVILLSGSLPDLGLYETDCDKSEFLVSHIFQILSGGA